MGPIHRTTPSVIKQGMEGWPVFALQRALNAGFRARLVEDASFGAATGAALRAAQTDLGTKKPDGIAGLTTMRGIGLEFAEAAEHAERLPARLAYSVVDGESNCHLAAVNWSVAGGVDCGAVQRRVYALDFDDEAVIRRAFDARAQIASLADNLRTLHGRFLARPGTEGDSELAYRLAVLSHNFPYAAEKVSQVGIASLGPSWREPKPWVTAIGAHFADGAPVRSSLDWCAFYSLGSAAHNDRGRMVRYVDPFTHFYA